MPSNYIRSRARKDFESFITGLALEISTPKMAGLSPTQKELILSSAMLRSSARIEVYISELFSDIFRNINLRISSGRIVNTQIPLPLKSYLFSTQHRSHFENYITTRNEDVLIKRLSASDSAVSMFDNGIKPKHINAKAIYSNCKYPSPDNITKLFCRLGVSNPFSHFGRISKKDVLTKWISFQDVRTSLAHDNLGVGLNENDVLSHLSSANLLVSSMDKLLCEYISTHFLKVVWSSVK